jgi:hypothetical protein
MPDIDSQIRKHVDAFVAEISALVQQAVFEAIAAGVRNAGGRLPSTPGRGGLAVARRDGGRRTAAELDELSELILAEVRAHPGRGIEAIGKALSVPTRKLSRPVQKLLNAGSLRRAGQKRATKYFPGSGRRRGGGKKRAKG